MPSTEASPRSAKWDLLYRSYIVLWCFLFLLFIVCRGLDCTLMHVLLKASLVELDICGHKEGGNYFLITVFKVKGRLTLSNQILDTIYGSNLSHTILIKAKLYRFSQLLISVIWATHLLSFGRWKVIRSVLMLLCMRLFAVKHTLWNCAYTGQLPCMECVQWCECVYTVHTVCSPPCHCCPSLYSMCMGWKELLFSA